VIQERDGASQTGTVGQLLRVRPVPLPVPVAIKFWSVWSLIGVGVLSSNHAANLMNLPAQLTLKHAKSALIRLTAKALEGGPVTQIHTTQKVSYIKPNLARK